MQDNCHSASPNPPTCNLWTSAPINCQVHACSAASGKFAFYPDQTLGRLVACRCCDHECEVCALTLQGLCPQTTQNWMDFHNWTSLIMPSLGKTDAPHSNKQHARSCQFASRLLCSMGIVVAALTHGKDKAVYVQLFAS